MAIDPLIPVDPSVSKAAGPAAPEQAKGADFLFHLIDIINPLQHIPIVSTIYRKITGDEIAPAARLIGGGLFAGPIGLIAAAANIVADAATGQDIGERAIALFGSEPEEPLLAQAAQPLPNPQAAPAHEAPADKGNLANAIPPAPLPVGFLTTALTAGNASKPVTLVPNVAAQDGLADTILSALDKYQAMARDRNGLTDEVDED